jgi:hypothetical protein
MRLIDPNKPKLGYTDYTELELVLKNTGWSYFRHRSGDGRARWHPGCWRDRVHWEDEEEMSDYYYVWLDGYSGGLGVPVEYKEYGHRGTSVTYHTWRGFVVDDRTFAKIEREEGGRA